MRASANVHPVSVRTHRGDNYTDECEKTNNTPEDRHGGLKKLIENCGSWPVLQRRVAWIVRFCQWIANGRVARFTGRLTLEELSRSAQAIVRSAQKECFAEDVEQVSQNKEVKISSRLRSLRPVLENGVLRVGGRLQRAEVLSWDEKHPMILPKHHHVSQVIVRHYHEFSAHSGENKHCVSCEESSGSLVEEA